MYHRDALTANTAQKRSAPDSFESWDATTNSPEAFSDHEGSVYTV